MNLFCIYLWQWNNLQQCMVFIINEYPAGENWKTVLNLFEASGSPWLTEKQQTKVTSLLDMFALASLTVNPRKLTDVWSIPKMTALLLDRKVSLPALTSTLISVIVSTKEIVHYSINTHTFHMSFLFWSEISFHHPLTVELDDFHSLREYIANVHRFWEFLKDSRQQWEWLDLPHCCQSVWNFPQRSKFGFQTAMWMIHRFLLMPGIRISTDFTDFHHRCQSVTDLVTGWKSAKSKGRLISPQNLFDDQTE